MKIKNIRKVARKLKPEGKEENLTGRARNKLTDKQIKAKTDGK